MQKDIESKGSIAFVTLQVRKNTNEVIRVFYGRNTSPLTVKLTDNSLILRSEGEVDSIKPNVLYCLDIKSWKIESVEVPIGQIMSIGRSQWARDMDDYANNDNAYGEADAQVLDVENQKLIDDIDRQLAILEDQFIEAIDNKNAYHNMGDVVNMDKMKSLAQEIEDKMDMLEADRDAIIMESIAEDITTIEFDGIKE